MQLSSVRVACFLVLGAIVARPSAADRKEIPFFVDSESLILSSKTIFSFRVESLSKKIASVTDPVRQGNYMMSATVLRKYKGSLREREGQIFSASPLIYVGAIRGRPLGVWAVITQQDLPKEGSVWVAFCAGHRSQISAEESLKGAGLDCRLAGVDAILDLELADQSEQKGKLGYAIDLLLLNRQKDILYYAEYLFSRYRLALEGNQDWPRLFSLIEDSSGSRNLRYTLMSAIGDALSSAKELPLHVQAGFARSLVHAAFLEGDDQERENILAIELRNCIKAVPGRILPTSMVLSEHPDEKARLRAILATLATSPDLRLVSAWLENN